MRPAFLDSMSWAMAEVYASVTDRILINMASYFPYIQNGKEPRNLFRYQAKMLAQVGQVNSETVDIIMESLGGGDVVLRASLEAAIIDAVRKEEPELREAAEKGLLNGPGLLAPEVDPGQMRAFRTYYAQAADKLNLVNTVMLESTEAAYRATVADVVNRIQRTQSILNVAAGETISGVSSWNTAMHDAVQKMMENGLTGFIDHAGRHWSPEAYVAMDIRTTMFAASRAAIWELDDEYGNDLYQVSSHNGARPLCYPWQRKVISRADAVRDVEDLYGNVIHVHAQSEIPDFQYGGGLFGVNCRHYPMTFVPGFSTLKGKPQDPEENEEVYQATQTQRGLERKLRSAKAELQAAQVQGADDDVLDRLKAKVRSADAELQEFCDESGLPRRRNREYTPVDASFPPESTYDPVEFPTEVRDRMREFYRERGKL